ncbi:hypothetical protein L228DRAFT_99045 [Xylona heveae TC161]|uniref:Frequency clock protein n=1 Tax=Xylona heveae (strain CBS 132557 / TC161) TaxID=1328760 RepID=A0A165I8T0_XYLHT|nr:hypothetical protein L228DRAFT_99045 [Xylona heveae TC161]KZF24552.1 hypothetical protein L228DRAFT_99045 [Xylona heveae TC161]
MAARAPDNTSQKKPVLTSTVLPTRPLPPNETLQSTPDRSILPQAQIPLNAADEWFQFRNNNVSASLGNTFLDVDPPFLIGSLPARDRPHDIRSTAAEIPEMEYNEMGPPYHGPPQSDSNAEAYRDVIDDLTVENQHLKRRLKKYRRQQSTNVHGEKLFELRIHGLPANRRRELEEVLQTFAATVGGSSNVDITSTTRSSGQTSSGSASASEHYHRVPASAPGTVDSAYVSNSKSGLLSVPSFNSQRSLGTDGTYTAPRPARHQSMPEKVKKRLVVARLEQLFTGTSLFPGAIGPTQWQPPKPNDSPEFGLDTTMGLSQGSREAPILPREVELSEDPLKSGAVDGSSAVSAPRNILRSPLKSASIDSGLSMPEQRPTGPMDIDLQRAQIPADNFYYIRHLGLSKSDSDSRLSFSKPQGWIYLNVLTNMAQLHTLNVTPDFVKDAVAFYSDKFQLSQDGQKVRWIGSSDSTVANAEGSSSEETDKNFSHWDKRRKLDGSKGTSSVPSRSSMSDSKSRSRRAETSTGSESQSKSNYLAYTTLFSHDRESSRESSDENMSDIAHWHHSQALPNDHRRYAADDRKDLSSSHLRESADGPIVFYNGAKFFTDLGGDPFNSHHSCHDPPAYHRMTSDVVGRASPTKTAQSGNGSRSSNGTEPTATDFEVSGLGGVQPEDNFLVKVSNRQKISPPASQTPSTREVSPFSVPKSRVKKIIHSIPQAAISAFADSNVVSPANTSSSSPSPPVSGAGASGTSSDTTSSHAENVHRLRQRIAASRDPSVGAATPRITLEPISRRHVAMPPSSLPPASCVFFPFSSDDSGNSSMEDEQSGTEALSINNEQDHHNAPLLAPVPLSIHYSGESGSAPASLSRENSGETSGTLGESGNVGRPENKSTSSGQFDARTSDSMRRLPGYVAAGRRTVGKMPTPLRVQRSSSDDQEEEENHDVVASDETENGG